jgi:hypothetical protein
VPPRRRVPDLMRYDRRMAEVFASYLSAHEIAALSALASAGERWKPGRQGTGYDILPLRGALPDGPGTLVARSLALLGTPFDDHWDAYLIRYPDGSHIAGHVDDAQYGKRHRRINAMLTAATGGGELRIDGQRIDLAVGDAVRFFPDREVHEVSQVVGTRLLFSVGAWIEP